MSTKSNYVVARKKGDQYLVLCKHCGVLHRHGAASQGHRIAHCDAEGLGGFGNIPSGYSLVEVTDKLGQFNKAEVNTAVRLAKVANQALSGIGRLLDEAEIDPASEVALLVEQARQITAKLGSVAVDKENPSEKIPTGGLS